MKNKLDTDPMTRACLARPRSNKDTTGAGSESEGRVVGSEVRKAARDLQVLERT